MLTSPTSPKASAMFSKVSAIVSPLSPGSDHHNWYAPFIVSIIVASIVMIIMIVCSKHCQINAI